MYIRHLKKRGVYHLGIRCLRFVLNNRTDENQFLEVPLKELKSMKKLILLAGVVLFLLPNLNAQVDIDRPINLSGSDASDRSITNLSPPVNGTDAANKNYVDAAAGTPSLAQAAIDALTGVALGTVVYNTTTNCLNFYNGIEWFSLCGPPAVGTITTLNCAGATNNGILSEGQAASSVNSVISYTGGNGGIHTGQTVSSTGVTGLTAALATGTFANGAGTLTYSITGTPTTSGTASFAINIGGQSCILTRTVAAVVPNVCNLSNPTAIVDVTNPITGKTWMDRNIGASRAATSSTDNQAYGSLYQWGRGSDGHQCVNRYIGDGVSTSGITSVTSSSTTPASSSFITEDNNWYTGSNPDNLWQGVSGINTPCPAGYRLPTLSEWEAEYASWGIGNQNAVGAFASMLKLPMAGYRLGGDGALGLVNSQGLYWSDTFNTPAEGASRNLVFNNTSGGSGIAVMSNSSRVAGMSVRCIKN